MRKYFYALLIIILYATSTTTASNSGDTLDPPKWLVSLWTPQQGVLLTWQMPPKAIRTAVFRMREGDDSYEVLSQGELGYFMDKGVTEGIYLYKLQAFDSKNNSSSFSDERYVIVESIGEPKDCSSPPIWSESFATAKRVLLRWEDNCDVQRRGFNLYKKVKGEDKDYKLFKSVTEPNFIDKDVVEGQTISYKVCSLDVNLQEIACSEEMSVKISVGTAQLPENIPDFIVRKTVLVKYLKLPDNQEFISPTDIKVDTVGKIYVADTGSGLIHIFTYKGVYERSIGRVKKDDGTSDKFENLLGIDVDRKGFIYAVDAYKGELKVFNQKGVIILKVALKTALQKRPEYNFKKFGLVDVAVDIVNNVIYIVDNFNNHVYKLNRTGELLEVLFNKGQKPEQVHLPTFIYVDKKQDILLSDTMNQRITVYDQNAEPKMVFGRVGNVLGTFVRPKGIASDPKGDIFVADSYTNSIQVFSPEGEFKYILGGKKFGQLDIVTPNGIFIDKKNKIYVVEKLINRIQIRQLTDQTKKINK